MQNGGNMHFLKQTARDLRLPGRRLALNLLRDSKIGATLINRPHLHLQERATTTQQTFDTAISTTPPTNPAATTTTTTTTTTTRYSPTTTRIKDILQPVQIALHCARIRDKYRYQAYMHTPLNETPDILYIKTSNNHFDRRFATRIS